jgi:hypothetical protein
MGKGYERRDDVLLIASFLTGDHLKQLAYWEVFVLVYMTFVCIEYMHAPIQCSAGYRWKCLLAQAIENMYTTASVQCIPACSAQSIASYTALWRT